MTRDDLWKLSCRYPIDGTEIYWRRLINYDEDIWESRAVYHVDTPWELHPWSEGANTQGADFIDQWAIEDRYRGGEFMAGGRAVGWSNFLTHLVEDDLVFLSLTGAEVELRRRIRDRLKRMREEYLQLEEHLALLEITPWPQALTDHNDNSSQGDPT